MSTNGCVAFMVLVAFGAVVAIAFLRAKGRPSSWADHQRNWFLLGAGAGAVVIGLLWAIFG